VISQVQTGDLGAVWPRVRPLVERALRHGQGDGTSVEVVLAGLVEGVTQLWVIHEGDDIQACIVLSVTSHPKGRKVFVELLSGEGMDDWADALEGLLRDFKDLTGSACIEASCRKGLARYLSRRGWKTKAVIMSLE